MSLVERPLDGKLAVITGGSRGIGRAISLKLASIGAQVVVTYVSNASLADDVVSEILTSGGKARAAGFDVADEQAVVSAFKDIEDELGAVGILVNNAGVALDFLTVRGKGPDWQRTLDVNLSSSFYCSRAVSKGMMKERWGRIVNISSVIGEMGNAGQGAYAASKAGLIGFTKSLARELGSRGITVNAVAPGFIATDMTSRMSEEAQQSLLKQIPLGCLGVPEDVAEAVAFLCLPVAKYITGQVLNVNGGMYM